MRAFLMVETDRAVAFVMDDIPARQPRAGSKEPDAYVISKDAFSKPSPRIMLRKDDPRFKKVVDAATAALYTSGEGARDHGKWFCRRSREGAQSETCIGRELKKEFASLRIPRILTPTRCRACRP